MFFKKKNKLEIYREYEYHDDYNTQKKVRKSTIKSIQKRLDKQRGGVVGVFISSKFNGLYYPVFDLDDVSKLNLFQRINKDIPYIILQSSVGHYWGILDTQNKIKTVYVNGKKEA